MARIMTVFLIFIGRLYSQDYIDVQTSTDGYKHELLENIKKITFDGSNMIFEMNSGTEVTESLDNIINITFTDTPQSDQSLPVELVSFNATKSGDVVTLYWRTASEIANNGFEIERLYSAISQWEKLDFINGAGSCSKSTDYTYNDNKVKGLNNLKYRLKQIDYDGSFEYSAEIGVTTEEIIIPEEFTLHNNYPNPFNPTTTISYQIVETNLTTIKIYDMLGQEVEVLLNENQTPGTYEVSFNGSQLSSGVYFCKLTSGRNIKLIKMLLVK